MEFDYNKMMECIEEIKERKVYKKYEINQKKREVVKYIDVPEEGAYEMKENDTVSCNEFNTQIYRIIYNRKDDNNGVVKELADNCIKGVFAAFGVTGEVLKKAKINDKSKDAKKIRKKWWGLFKYMYDEAMGKGKIAKAINENGLLANQCFLFFTDYVEDNYPQEFLNNIREYVNRKIYKVKRQFGDGCGKGCKIHYEEMFESELQKEDNDGRYSCRTECFYCTKKEEEIDMDYDTYRFSREDENFFYYKRDRYLTIVQKLDSRLQQLWKEIEECNFDLYFENNGKTETRKADEFIVLSVINNRIDRILKEVNDTKQLVMILVCERLCTRQYCRHKFKNLCPVFQNFVKEARKRK